jgi:small GTP-binding protein
MKTGEFLEQTSATIGAGVTALEVDLATEKFALQLWDTAGQEMYRSVIPIYFKGSVYAILVFAMDDLHSLQSLDGWMEQIALHSDPEIGIVLVGTKCDKQRTVSEAAARDYAEQHKLALFLTSSVTGQNVGFVLQHVAEECAKKAAKSPEKEQEVIRNPPPPAPEPDCC